MRSMHAGSDAGKDFDFGASTPAAAAPKSDRNASGFAASLDDFWDTPALPRRDAPVPAPAAAPAPRVKTLEEVEAELRSQRAAAAAVPPPAPRPLTLEEVEAQLLVQRRAAAAARPPAPPGLVPRPSPGVGAPGAVPSPRVPHAAAVPRPPGLMGVPPVSVSSVPRAVPPTAAPAAPISTPPAAPAMAAPPSTVPAAVRPPPQAEHLARMRALLEACPAEVQQAILALPPPIQFDSLEGVVQRHPALVRDGGTGEAEAAVQWLVGQAPARLAQWQAAEERRRARAAKLAHIARYNGVMSGSDKDFITRIQISHLVSPDPYTDDFYAHVYFAVRGGGRRIALPDSSSIEAIAQHKHAEQSGGDRRLKGRKLTRHENAMLRMQQQVERLVDSRKKREAKGAVSSLSGTLGRVSLVSANKPRQMLQLINQADTKAAPVADAGSDDASTMRAALAGASLGDAARAPQDATRQALTRREALAILERLYSLVLQLEQLRREPDANADEQQRLVDTLWRELRVLEPLGVSDPHPFVSLLAHVKGKRLLPRALRLLDAEQALTTLTMLVASFEALDAVRHYGAYEQHLVTEPLRHVRSPLTTQQAVELSRSVDAFSNSVLFCMMGLINSASLRIVSGMVALLMERNDVLRIAKTRPGVSLLTSLLSRAGALRHATGADAPAPEDIAQWTSVFGVLFGRLTANAQLPELFYSTRARAYEPFGVDLGVGARDADAEDEHVWNFMALLAIHADLAQQQVLVQELRDKILSNVLAANEARAGADDVRIRNVNLLLHALNLDAAQITL